MRPLLRALARSPDPLSDAALLARYAADRDPAAFEVLVWRHGGLVLGVCRRHLRDAHLAEDAFQATFLVLARRASRVRAETLPGWLHRVARRTAGRAALKQQRRRETPLAADPPVKAVADPELAAVLDAEIDRLPERLRQVVVLCYLDGQPTEAAAARLNVPRGTVLSRLHAARAKLRDRLTRRGVTPPAVGLTAVLTAEQVAGGVRAAGGGLGAATLLANEVLHMATRKLAAAVACGLVLAGGAGTGWGVLTAQSGGPGAGGLPAALTPVELKRAEEKERQFEALRAEANKRRRKLEAVLTDLDNKIKARRDAIERQQRLAGASADAATGNALITALLQDLNRIRGDIYTEEAAIRMLEIGIQKHKQHLSALDTVPLSAEELEVVAKTDPTVQEKQQTLNLLERKLDAMLKSLDGESPAVAGLREQIRVARAEVNKALEALRPTIEKAARAASKAKVARDLKNDGELFDRRKQFLDGLQAMLRQKEHQLTDLRAGQNALKVEDDDLKPLLEQRAIITQMMVREQIEDHLGEKLAAPDKLDTILAELRELRRLVEAKK